MAPYACEHYQLNCKFANTKGAAESNCDQLLNEHLPGFQVCCAPGPYDTHGGISNIWSIGQTKKALPHIESAGDNATATLFGHYTYFLFIA